MNNQMNGRPTKKLYTEPTALQAHYRDALIGRLQQDAQAGRSVYDAATDSFIDAESKLRLIGAPANQMR